MRISLLLNSTELYDAFITFLLPDESSVILKIHDLLIIFTYISLLNFLIGLLIMLALDHLSYLIDSYLLL